MSIPLSDNQELLKNPQYHKILEVCNRIVSLDGVIFPGNCIGLADMVQTLLQGIGISSKIVEVEVSVVRNDGTGRPNFLFIGYDGALYPTQVDTHTVVITEDKNPILIDLSISHVIPQSRPFIIELANLTDAKQMLSIQIENVSVTYKQKMYPKFPNVHQKNIVQRIASDEKIKSDLSILKTFIIGALTLGLVNFTLNIILIVLRLFDITL